MRVSLRSAATARQSQWVTQFWELTESAPTLQGSSVTCFPHHYSCKEDLSSSSVCVCVCVLSHTFPLWFIAVQKVSSRKKNVPQSSSQWLSLARLIVHKNPSKDPHIRCSTIHLQLATETLRVAVSCLKWRSLYLPNSCVTLSEGMANTWQVISLNVRSVGELWVIFVTSQRVTFPAHIFWKVKLTL